MIKTKKPTKEETFKLFDSIFEYVLKEPPEEKKLIESIEAKQLLLQQNINDQKREEIEKEMYKELRTLNNISLNYCAICKKLLNG